MTDVRFFEEVAAELDRREARPGLWAKAYAEAGGDESATRARYIALRAAELASPSEERARRVSALRLRKTAIDLIAVACFLGCLACGVDTARTHADASLLGLLVSLGGLLTAKVLLERTVREINSVESVASKA